MVRRFGLVVMVILALTFIGATSAQDNDNKTTADRARTDRGWSFYKLDLTVKEMDGGKAINSRTYNISQATDEWGQLRVGSRLPIATNSPEGKAPTQWSYFDVGLNMDSKLREKDGAVSLDWRLELSSPTESGNTMGPVVRTLKNNGQTVLAIGKPVLLASVDDVSSTHKFVFEVTATKLK